MKNSIGSVVSADLTVPDADSVRDFYKEVIGWEVEHMKMTDESGEYADYVMKDAEGTWVGGVCHAKGANLDIPPQWIVYINVADISESISKCLALGGRIIKESRSSEGILQYAIIEDPAGAVLGLTRMT